jgi:hypothetical protein
VRIGRQVLRVERASTSPGMVSARSRQRRTLVAARDAPINQSPRRSIRWIATFFAQHFSLEKLACTAEIS